MASLKDDGSIEIAITNFSTCCRLCLSSSDAHSYYDIANTSLGSEIDISTIEAIQMVINIEIALNEHLPSRICGLCYTRLDDAYCFIRDSVRNNDLFLNNSHSESMDSDSEAMSNCNETCKEEMRLEIASDRSELELAETQTKQQKGSKRGSTTTQNSNDEGQPNDLTAVDFVLQHIESTVKPPRRIRPKGEPSHHCNECNKSFLRRSNLLDHQRLHAQVKMYVCEYCDKRFVQSGNLKMHLRTHTDEKPYFCPVCGKAFAQSSALRTHERTHANIRPYPCDMCDKAFMSSSDRTKHKFIHATHKPFRCVICLDRYFTQKIHLRKHLLRMHPSSDMEQKLQAGIARDDLGD